MASAQAIPVTPLQGAAGSVSKSGWRCGPWLARQRLAEAAEISVPAGASMAGGDTTVVRGFTVTGATVMAPSSLASLVTVGRARISGHFFVANLALLNSPG